MRFAFALWMVLAVASCSTPPARCTPDTCSSGCCSNDLCLDGTTDSACGTGAAACVTCPMAQHCDLHRCGGAGGGAGQGGGTAGGTTGTGGGTGGTGGGTTGTGGTGGGTSGTGGGTSGTGGGTNGTGGGTGGGTSTALCDLNYRVAAMPSSQTCLTGTIAWPNPIVRLTELPDAGLLITGAFGDAGTIALRGSWDGGARFSAAGASTISFGGFPITVTNTVSGQLRACDAWSGTWRQASSICNLDWTVDALKQ